MCTIVVASRVREDLPLIVGANRDEFLGRAALPPHELRPGVVAGVDLARGGSWLGATRSGLFVGLTNQHTERLMAEAPRSRGEVVLGALDTGSLDGALEYLRALDPTLYNPFNLLLGDARRLFVAYSWQGLRVELRELPPGVHVLANDQLRSPLYPKAQRAEALAAPWLAQPWPALRGGLASMLADHQLPEGNPLGPVCDELLRPVSHQLQALCVHTEHNYGTRSASLVAVGPAGLARYEFADGSPCVTPFVDVLPSLPALLPGREGPPPARRGLGGGRPGVAGLLLAAAAALLAGHVGQDLLDVGAAASERGFSAGGTVDSTAHVGSLLGSITARRGPRRGQARRSPGSPGPGRWSSSPCSPRPP